jgi:hypothetical protein
MDDSSCIVAAFSQDCRRSTAANFSGVINPPNNHATAQPRALALRGVRARAEALPRQTAACTQQALTPVVEGQGGRAAPVIRDGARCAQPLTGFERLLCANALTGPLAQVEEHQYLGGGGRTHAHDGRGPLLRNEQTAAALRTPMRGARVVPGRTTLALDRSSTAHLTKKKHGNASCSIIKMMTPMYEKKYRRERQR